MWKVDKNMEESCGTPFPLCCEENNINEPRYLLEPSLPDIIFAEYYNTEYNYYMHYSMI